MQTVMSELAIYRVGKLVAMFCFIIDKALAAEMTWHSWVYLTQHCWQCGSYKVSPVVAQSLKKIENTKYLAYF